jgi:hypothetical protein
LYFNGDPSDEEYDQMRNEMHTKLNQPEPEVCLQPSEFDQMYDLVQDIGVVWKMAILEARYELAHLLFERLYLEDGQIKKIMPTAVLSALICGSSWTSNGEDRIRTCGPACDRTTA